MQTKDGLFSMNRNVIFGIVLALVVTAVFVTLVFVYTGKGNSLASAVDGSSCTGDPASCSNGSSGCTESKTAGGCSSSGSMSCGGGGSAAYYDPNVDYGKIERDAVAFYAKKTGDNAVIAKAFGIDTVTVVIYKEDKEMERYRYENGNFVK